MVAIRHHPCSHVVRRSSRVTNDGESGHHNMARWRATGRYISKNAFSGSLLPGMLSRLLRYPMLLITPYKRCFRVLPCLYRMYYKKKLIYCIDTLTSLEVGRRAIMPAFLNYAINNELPKIFFYQFFLRSLKKNA